MIKVVTVVGARPQIIKAAALSRAIREKFSDKISEYLIHTGQHYDANMSQVFFDELNIPRPAANLNIGSAPHGKQTALMLQGIEEILTAQKPDFLVLYGDTNSTLAGAIAGVKMHIPVVHIEAGLRSFNKSMPEEINRIMCDHASTLMFVPSATGVRNLQNEGFRLNNDPPFTPETPGIFHCGDIMFDNLMHFFAIAEQKTDIMQRLQLKPNGFVLCTIHRDNNTDVPERLEQIVEAICHIAENMDLQVVIPFHPRTTKIIQSALKREVYQRLTQNPNIISIPPVSYLEMILLEKYARLVMTDSGGVQKEAYFFEKPLVVVRPETEWVEIIENKAGIIADADKNRIITAIEHFLSLKKMDFPPVFGDGHAAEFICKTILANTERKG